MINPKEIRINCRELRIGNWYHDSQRNRDFVVQEIRSMCIEHGDDDYSPTRIDQIDGIPLTSEWLERFGAIKDEGKNRYRLLNRLIVVRSNNFVDYGSNVTLNTVHQTQNFFYALTGTELTLKDNEEL